MTSSNHKINKVCQLQYNCFIFCENFDTVCWEMSEILDHFHYLLTDPRTLSLIDASIRKCFNQSKSLLHAAVKTKCFDKSKSLFHAAIKRLKMNQIYHPNIFLPRLVFQTNTCPILMIWPQSDPSYLSHTVYVVTTPDVLVLIPAKQYVPLLWWDDLTSSYLSHTVYVVTTPDVLVPAKQYVPLLWWDDLTPSYLSHTVYVIATPDVLVLIPAKQYVPLLWWDDLIPIWPIIPVPYCLCCNHSRCPGPGPSQTVCPTPLVGWSDPSYLSHTVYVVATPDVLILIPAKQYVPLLRWDDLTPSYLSHTVYVVATPDVLVLVPAKQYVPLLWWDDLTHHTCPILSML